MDFFGEEFRSPCLLTSSRMKTQLPGNLFLLATFCLIPLPHFPLVDAFINISAPDQLYSSRCFQVFCCMWNKDIACMLINVDMLIAEICTRAEISVAMASKESGESCLHFRARMYSRYDFFKNADFHALKVAITASLCFATMYNREKCATLSFSIEISFACLVFGFGFMSRKKGKEFFNRVVNGVSKVQNY